MNLTGRPPLGLKAPPEPRDPDRLAAVAELTCCICYEFGLPQLSPTQVHHCIHGRNAMAARAPDSMTIPLFEGHHQGMFDTSKIALHREPDAWRAEYGNDTEWIGWTEQRVGARGQKEIVKGECAADGCLKRSRHSGYCSRHYRRLLKYGDPLGGGTYSGAPHAWIIKNAGHAGEDCLAWPFSSAEGYYSLSRGNGTWTKAHRAMCEAAHGRPQPGQFALHSCGNKSCVNPRHLRWGTAKQNTADAIASGTFCKGDNSPAAKITARDVREIRRRAQNGEGNKAISQDYPVKPKTIWAIVNRKIWKHIK